MKQDKLIGYAAELQSLAQAGLFYGKDEYGKERYRRIREIAAELLATETGIPLERVTELFCSDYGYQTPKVDTRAAIFRGGKILLVHEADGRWSLPGGWCEYNMSPADNTVKEAFEEAGRKVVPTRVIAVQNRDAHNKPKYVYGVVKIFYLCEELGGEFQMNVETTEARYFAEDALPPLAEEKCNEEQVIMCFEAYRNADMKTVFD